MNNSSFNKAPLPSINFQNSALITFWDVLQYLHQHRQIEHGKDFLLQDSCIYLRIMQVYPLFVCELMRRKNFDHHTTKSCLEDQLRLEKDRFVEYTRKSFPDGSNNWTFKLKYAKSAGALSTFAAALKGYGIDTEIFYNAN